MKRAWLSISWLVVLLAFTSCQRTEKAAVVDVQFGVDTCAQCGSTIQDPKFASLYTLNDGGSRLFDDPGCLFRKLREETSDPVLLVFHEYQGSDWLEGDEVFFAQTPAIQSPQGYGWAAYGSFGDAQTAVTSAGSGELLSLPQAKEKIGVSSP